MARDEAAAALAAHRVPAWFEDAKFGIFIHWGLFSIPAFAPNLGSIAEVFQTHYDRAVALTPYTEWYWNALKVPGTPSAEFHKSEYGGRPYQAFREPFLEGLRQWDPAAWAEAFRDAGARYVVLVTKHHDGFCLWPSGVRNPKQDGWTTTRDVVGELAAAVRAQGMKFGTYYSGGIDWTFNPRPLRTLGDFITSAPGGAYPDYAEAQVRELIDRYEPSVLWNDISWPGTRDDMLTLFSDYYDAVPEGVINDRWMPATTASRLMRNPVGRFALDVMLKRHMKTNPPEGVIPPLPPHCDFRTPEYTVPRDMGGRKWEATRGMSHSFGFNRNDTEADYLSADELVQTIATIVSRNGNLLLNVGPRGVDAGIPDPQLARLRAVGDWLRVNGEAIYGTRPHSPTSVTSAEGPEVVFTIKGDDVYVILLGQPAGQGVTLPGVALAGAGTLLSDGSPVTVSAEGETTTLRFSHMPASAPAHAVRISRPTN